MLYSSSFFLKIKIVIIIVYFAYSESYQLIYSMY